MQNQQMGSFSGDMDRNEVEIDLNKFMALLSEKSALKDRIRELEDIKNDNPYQRWIFVAQAIDSWRLIPRAFLSVYMFLLYYVVFWFMALEDPSTATNPRKMTVDDMKILYEHSISGKLF